MADKPFYPGNYIRRFVDAGLSAEEALTQFRRQVGSVDEREFRTLYGQVESALQHEETLGRINLGRRPVASELQQWSTRTRAGYLYQMDIIARIEGTDITYRKPFSARYDQPVSYRKAMADALASFEEGRLPDEDGNPGTGDGEEPLGAVVINVFELVPDE